MFVVFAAILSLTIISTILATPIYEGVVQIIIERVEPNNLTGTNRQARDPEFEKTQFQLIRSHSVALKVVKSLDLEETFEAAQSPKSISWTNEVLKDLKGVVISLTSFFDFSKQATGEEGKVVTSKADLIATELSKNVRVRPVQGSDIVPTSSIISIRLSIIHGSKSIRQLPVTTSTF